MAGPSPLRLEFLRSSSGLADLPASVAELAVVGRSNVGKSSLLNALAHRKSLARTSKTPGATRSINVYELDEGAQGRWLVDLPGYGYAKVSAAERTRWQHMIEGYLTRRETLRGALVLIDAEVGPTALDLQTVEWLDHIGLDLHLVATKIDKVRPSKSKKRRTELVSKLGVARSEVVWVSAHSGTGIGELRTLVRHLLT